MKFLSFFTLTFLATLSVVSQAWFFYWMLFDLWTLGYSPLNSPLLVLSAWVTSFLATVIAKQPQLPNLKLIKKKKPKKEEQERSTFEL